MKNEFLGQISEIIIFAAILGFLKTIDNKFHLGIPLGIEIVISAVGVAIYIVGKYKYKKRKKDKEEIIKKKIREDEILRIKSTYEKERETDD